MKVMHCLNQRHKQLLFIVKRANLVFFIKLYLQLGNVFHCIYFRTGLVEFTGISLESGQLVLFHLVSEENFMEATAQEIFRITEGKRSIMQKTGPHELFLKSGMSVAALIFAVGCTLRGSFFESI